ncbi:glycosyltransferase family 1 protein [soil metagenome]
MPSVSAAPAAAETALARGATRIYINGRFLIQKLTGVQRAATEIVRALDGLLEGGEIDERRFRILLLAPRGAADLAGLRHIRVREVGRLQGHAWEQAELPWHGRDGVLLCLGNTAPVLRRRQVAVVYDASVFAAPEGYSHTFATLYRLLLPAIGRTAHAVVTPSAFSKAELSRHVGVPEDKMRVVPLGAEHLHAVPADRGMLERHGLAGRRYVLAVSSRNPNKNFAAVLATVQALRGMGVELVIAGGSNPRVFGSGAEISGGSKVTEVGYVSDSELRSLYEHAAAFVFPSRYEGFGLPPLEAMSLGCPVIASDIPVLREICGNAALFFDPEDSGMLAATLCRLLSDPETAEKLRAEGRRRAQRFTWTACAREIFSVVESVPRG